MSSVKRVEVSKVLMPRSQRITSELPSLTMYSAAISRSSTVEDGPRLSSTGLLERPTSSSSEKFDMLRAPIWMTSVDLDHELDVARVHQLGDEGQAGLLARLLEDLERFLAEALEGVRRGARLEGAPAEHRHALLRDGARRLHRLLARLDRARAGDEAEVPVADPPAADVDHRRVGRELTRDELVRLEDRQHLLDAGIALERQRRQQLAVADRSDHGRLAAGRHDRAAARLLEARDDVVDLFGVAAPPITIRSSGAPVIAISEEGMKFA